MALCYSHQACCLLYYLAEINSDNHMYQLSLNLYTSVFRCARGFRFQQKFWQIHRFGRKKGMDRQISIPLFTPPPSLNTAVFKRGVALHRKGIWVFFVRSNDRVLKLKQYLYSNMDPVFTVTQGNSRS